MTKTKGLSLLLALCMMLSISAPALASETADVVGNWALVAAETADGTPYTAEQVQAIFQSSNFLLSLYSGGQACIFSGGRLADLPMDYTYDGEKATLSGSMEGSTLVMDPGNKYYAYMGAKDGSVYTFARATSIEGKMWVLTAGYDADGNKIPDETVMEGIGGQNLVLIFNYNLSIDTYLDGVAKESDTAFKVDADGNTVMYNVNAPDEFMEVEWQNEEQFRVTNGSGSTMEYTIVYPLIGEWQLCGVVEADGTFVAEERPEEMTAAFGSSNVTITMGEDGLGYFSVDGEQAGESAPFYMNAGTVMIGDTPLEFDASGNLLIYDADGVGMVFARITAIVMPK